MTPHTGQNPSPRGSSTRRKHTGHRSGRRRHRAEGLGRVASACISNTQKLVNALTEIDGVECVFSGPRFHEAVLRLPQDADSVLAALTTRNILGGFALGEDYPELQDCILVCATEMRTEADINLYASTLADILAAN